MNFSIPLESLLDANRPYLLLIREGMTKISRLEDVTASLIFSLDMSPERPGKSLCGRLREKLEFSKVTGIQFPSDKKAPVTEKLLGDLKHFAILSEDSIDPKWKGPRSVTCKLGKQGMLFYYRGSVELQSVPENPYPFSVLNRSIASSLFKACPEAWIPGLIAGEILNVDYLLSELDQVYEAVGAPKDGSSRHPSLQIVFDFIFRQLEAIETRAKLAYTQEVMTTDLAALRMQLQVILAAMKQEVVATVTHGKPYALNALVKLVDKLFPETAKEREEVRQKEKPKITQAPVQVTPPSLDGTTLRITAAAMRSALARKWPNLELPEAIAKLRNASEQDQNVINEITYLFQVDDGKPASAFKSKESISVWCSDLAPRVIALINAS